MKGIIITSGGCQPCQGFRERFADLIASGEVEEKNLESDTEFVLGVIEKHGVNIPSFLIVTDGGELITAIQDEDTSNTELALQKGGD